MKIYEKLKKIFFIKKFREEVRVRNTNNSLPPTSDREGIPRMSNLKQQRIWSTLKTISQTL